MAGYARGWAVIPAARQACWQGAVAKLLMLSCLAVPADGPSPLIAEPEVTTHALQEGDEFILLGCDGLWDVFNSQRAVEFARTR